MARRQISLTTQTMAGLVITVLTTLNRVCRHSGEGRIDRVAQRADAGFKLHGIITWNGPGSLTARGQSVVCGDAECSVSIRTVAVRTVDVHRDRHRARPSVCIVQNPTKTCVSEREAQLWQLASRFQHTKKEKRDDVTQSKSWYEPNRQA